MTGPLHDIDRWGYNIGRAWAKGLQEGLAGISLSEYRRAVWSREEAAAKARAEAAERHADWFAVLSWWRRLIAIVLVQ